MTKEDLLKLSKDPQVSAFLAVIRECEHTEERDEEKRYRALFGHKPKTPNLFDSFADHPRIVVSRKSRGTIIKSTAAGAYQYRSQTWDEMARKYKLPSFEPVWQDAGAVGLLIRRSAIGSIIRGALSEALLQCNKEWASLPGSPHSQPTKPYSFCRRVFEEHGGKCSGDF